MIDLEVNDKGEVVWRNGDLSLISGKDVYEQAIAFWLQEYYTHEIGESQKPENVISDLKVQARRVAAEFDRIDGIKNFRAERIEPGRYRIRLHYVIEGDEEFLERLLT